MIYPDFCFRDTAFGGVNKRNAVLKATEVSSAAPESASDCYATWHRFPDSYRSGAVSTGSTGGFKGPSYADFLPFDFDGDDLGAVQAKVCEFLKVLEVSYDIDNLTGVRCFFSGKKGFHVYLSPALFGGWSPSAKLPGALRMLSEKMGAGSDTAIYDQNRLLRLNNTKHSETGMFKVQLAPSTLLHCSIEEIMALAQNPQDYADDWTDAETVSECALLWKSILATPERHRDPGTPQILFPKLGEGEGRDVAAFRIARTLRDGHVERSLALEVLKLWDSTQSPSLVSTDGAGILEKKLQNAYGEVAVEEGGPISPEDIRTPMDLADDYSAYIAKLKERKIGLGWTEVDTTMRGIAPGEVVTIIAKSGVGKTAVLQNICIWLACQRVTNLFCSMEQPLAQCFERFVQMVTNQSGTVVEENWEATEKATREFVNSELGSYTLTCGIPGLTLPKLEEALDAAEAKTGKIVEVVAIDYMGLLDTHELDSTLYGQVSRAARELKNLAKRRDLVVILLCQVNRAAGDEGDTPLTMHSGRESGAIEESADFLIGLYRPDIKTDNRKICLQLLKSRKGSLGTWDLNFDTKSLRITS